MDAHIGRTGAAGADSVEQRQMPVCPIDGEGADRAFFALAHASRLIGRVESGSGRIQSQAARACSHLVNAGGQHRPGGAIHLEKVYASTIARRQIHLRWQHIAKRRTVAADVGNERPTGFIRARVEQTGDERGCSRQCDRSS